MIGYYAHHHGHGHLTRMRCIVGRTTHPVTVLSSARPSAADRMPWVVLERDDGSGRDEDATAYGRLHWVPRHEPGVARRAAQLTDWIVSEEPGLVVVDVSVEVATLVRLCGVPVVVMAMPGRRDDPAHALAYDLADTLLAPWPAEVETGWPERWLEKTVFLGGVSRFDDRSPAEPGTSPTGDRLGLLLWGSGGDGTGERVRDSLLAGTPGWRWEVAGLDGHRLDPDRTWRALCRADVVVTHAGQAAVAEVAAARRPAVVVADERPFDEQRCTTGRLARAGLAATVVGCPGPGQWPRLLSEALDIDPARWSAWNRGDGAAVAAATLERLAAEPATRR